MGGDQGGRIARETSKSLEVIEAHYSGKYYFSLISLLNLSMFILSIVGLSNE